MTAPPDRDRNADLRRQSDEFIVKDGHLEPHGRKPGAAGWRKQRRNRFTRRAARRRVAVRR